MLSRAFGILFGLLLTVSLLKGTPSFAGAVPEIPSDATLLYSGLVACPGGDLRQTADFDTNKDGEVDLRIFASLDGELLAFVFYVPGDDLPVRVAVLWPNKLGSDDIKTDYDSLVKAVCGNVKPLLKGFPPGGSRGELRGRRSPI